MPLFIPTERWVYTFGFRIGPGHWDDVSPELVGAIHAAVPKLERLGTLQGLLERVGDWEINCRKAEVRLTVGVLERDEQLVRETFDHVRGVEAELDWEQLVIDRATALGQLVVKHGWAAAEKELESRRPPVLELLS